MTTFIRARSGRFSLIEKRKCPETGRWSQRVVVNLEGHETPEAALAGYVADIPKIRAVIAECEKLAANRRFAYQRENRLDLIDAQEALSRRLGQIQALREHLGLPENEVPHA